MYLLELMIPIFIFPVSIATLLRSERHSDFYSNITLNVIAHYFRFVLDNTSCNAKNLSVSHRETKIYCYVGSKTI